MGKTTWVAAIALCLGGVIPGIARANGGAHDEHEEPTSMELLLQDRITAVEEELAQLRRQLDAMKEPSAQPHKHAEIKDTQRRIDELKEELASLKRDLTGGLPRWAGWKLQLYIADASWPILNGASSPAVLRLIEINGRYVWPIHLGVGASMSPLGFWFTKDDSGDSAQPWTGTGRAYAVVNLEYLAVTAGPRVSLFQNPTSGEPSFLAVAITGGLEWKPWKWLVLYFEAGPTVYSQLQRHSGLWLGGGIGMPLYPWPGKQ